MTDSFYIQIFLFSLGFSGFGSCSFCFTLFAIKWCSGDCFITTSDLSVCGGMVCTYRDTRSNQQNTELLQISA